MVFLGTPRKAGVDRDFESVTLNRTTTSLSSFCLHASVPLQIPLRAAGEAASLTGGAIMSTGG